MTADNPFSTHLRKVKSAVLGGYTLGSIPEWIQQNTFLRGAPFSFKGHEFQLEIARSPAREKVVRKCSQIGLSEFSSRVALATVNILDGTTAIYTLPTATFAKAFAKTRFDPIVDTSPALRDAVNATADNTELKQFGQSFLYIKGTVGTGAAISIPADAVFHDEVDFSDPEVMSNYQSRLTHSPWKLKYKFSTPTTEGYGISAEFAASMRHWNFVKCNHCGHQFLPSYFDHVKVPGFDGNLREITKETLHRIEYQAAYLACPKCGCRPDLSPEYREWVVENTGDNHEAAGFQVQPFDAPSIITIPDLVMNSTKYTRYVDFVNFALGLPAEDKESTLGRDEILVCFVRGEVSGFFTHVMGIDVGMVSRVMVGGVDHTGRVMTVHTEKVPMPVLVKRVQELRQQYRVAITVMDSQPYTETLLTLQHSDPNLYGSVYVTSKDLAPFQVKKQDEDPEVAKTEIRQVNVNRNKALDAVMHFVRAGGWTCREDENKEEIITHMQDMKRIKDFTRDNEVAYVWRKSVAGNDHFHHALLYLWVASQMKGVSGNNILLPQGILGMFKQTA